MEQDLLNQFITETMEKAGLKEAPVEFQNAYREKMATMLAQKIGQEASALLNEKDLEQLAVILEQNTQTSPADLYAFYNTHIQDFPQKMALIFKQFQDQYLKLMQTGVQ